MNTVTAAYKGPNLRETMCLAFVARATSKSAITAHSYTSIPPLRYTGSPYNNVRSLCTTHV